jgi:HK97 gp10 family phage protein
MELTVHSERLEAALRASPKRLTRELDRTIDRIVQEMAREARRRAPKAASTLTNSIRPSRPSALEGVVSAGADYARMVETGTGTHGPMGLASERMPPVDAIYDWVRVAQVHPRDPDMDQEGLAFVIARSIAQRGTPAQPFMEPAFDALRPRAERLIDKAISRAMRT